ncbi:MAG TPA: hypothetical protein VFH47_06750 [Candidatus Thermoplasmatota archaeon]|nr:hypothetical protein [Candidatus Thermoplasmatota archaeon]
MTRLAAADAARACAVLRLRLPDEASAQHALGALRPDDPGTVLLRTEGEVLVVEACSDTTMGLLRTVDDVLACLRATGIP